MHNWNLINSHLQCITDVSILGDGMNAYVAYKVSTRVCSQASVDTYILCIFTWLLKLPIYLNLHYCFLVFRFLSSLPSVYHQTSLPMFRSKSFSVRRRFSDFLGLYEKLSVKQSLHGCIIPPPPEKSVVGGCPGLFFFKSVFFCTFCPFCDCYLDQQEWPKWRWVWMTRHQ